MALTKALLVFCEGPHDVAFVTNIFKKALSAGIAKGTDGKNLKFSDYPSPFDKLFPELIKSHAQEDLTLDMSKKFFLADTTLAMDEHLILLFNSSSKDKPQVVKTFLQKFFDLYSENGAFVFQQDASSSISEARYLFIYDADHRTPNEIAQSMQKEFTSIANTDWTLDEWNIKEDERHVIQGDKALYVWAGDDGKGTLEDILLPIYEIEESELLDKSRNFVEGTFSWDMDNKNEQQRVALMANKKKAIICAAGQGKKPGGPLTAIINDRVLDNKKNSNIPGSPQVIEFTRFIKSFLSIEDS